MTIMHDTTIRLTQLSIPQLHMTSLRMTSDNRPARTGDSHVHKHFYGVGRLEHIFTFFFASSRFGLDNHVAKGPQQAGIDSESGGDALVNNGFMYL